MKAETANPPIPDCDFYDDKKADKQIKFVTESVVVSVPNGSPLEIVPYEAAVFATATTKTVFVEGMLTDVDVKRPSEALAVAHVDRTTCADGTSWTRQ